MDATAYLKRHGWRGTGHSLDHTDRGIKKPLLIAHKQDQLGLGNKKAAHKVDDQWWMRAFDESLKNIGTGQESTLSQVRKQGINRGGLYGFFVRGEALVGTISATEESSSAEASYSNSSTSPSQTSTPATSPSESSDNSESSSDTSDGSDSSSDTPDDSDSEAGLSVDELNMPSTEVNSKKRKREREAPAERRKKQKQEKAQIASTAAKKKREEGAYDEAAVKEAAVWRRISRELKWRLKERENAGEFGPLVPRPSEMKKNKRNQTAFIEDPENPDRKLTYKKAKFQRQQNMRVAKKELKKQIIVDAMMKGDLPNPKNYTRAQALENCEKDLAEREKAQKAENKRKKELEKVAAEARQAERLEAKKARREAKLKLDLDQGKPEKAKAEADPASNGQKKYPSKAEKRERKNAAAAGLTVEQYRIKLEVDKNQDAISAKIAKLDAEKKAQYEERAALKSQSLEHYVLQRIQKKAAEKTPAEEPVLFFADLEGDKTLLNQAAPGQPALHYQRNPDGSIPIDPIVWEGREVKSLSKEEREARRLWLKQRREKRNANKQKGVRATAHWQERGQGPKTRTERKMEQMRGLTGKILLQQGIKEKATPDQLTAARREAKSILKKEKKERKAGGVVDSGPVKLMKNKKGRHLVSERAKARNAAMAAAAGEA